MVSVTPRPLFTPWKDPVPIVQEAGWAPGPVWKGAENLDPSGFEPWTVQPVASRYTDYATPPTNGSCEAEKKNSVEEKELLNHHQIVTMKDSPFADTIRIKVYFVIFYCFVFISGGFNIIY